MTDFTSCEESSGAFMASVEKALIVGELLVRASVDTERAYSILVEEARSVLRTLVVARNDRTEPDVQRAIVRLLNRHIDTLNDARDGVPPTDTNESRVYRELLSLLSLHQRDGKQAQSEQSDTVLAFALTAEQPSADELDTDDPTVAESLARVRADLRASLLDGDVANVLALTESTIVAIGQKRDAHELAEYSYPPPAAYGDSLLLNADLEPVALGARVSNKLERARLLDRTLSPLRSLTLNVPTVLAAAHMSSRHKRSSLASRTKPAVDIDDVRDQLAPLRAWHDSPALTKDTLDQIDRIVADDAQYMRARKKIGSLKRAIGGSEAFRDFGPLEVLAPLDTLIYDTDDGLLQRSPDDEMGTLRALLGPWGVTLVNNETALPDKFGVAERARELADDYAREEHRDTLVRSTHLQVQTQRRLLMVQLHATFVARLVYLSAMAGSLCARVAPVYDYENSSWTSVKERFARLADAYELIQSVTLFEGTLRALAISTRQLVRSASKRAQVYIRIGSVLRALVGAPQIDSRNFLVLARDILLTVRPIIDDEQMRFVRKLLDSANAAFSLSMRALAESAVVMGTGAALARGISPDAAGEKRGINVYAFADTMHAASDVASHTNFALGAPILLATYPLLMTALLPTVN